MILISGFSLCGQAEQRDMFTSELSAERFKSISSAAFVTASILLLTGPGQNPQGPKFIDPWEKAGAVCQALADLLVRPLFALHHL